MLTKQTFKAIAEIIKEARSEQLYRENNNIPSDLIVNYIANDLADFFAKENPQFDRDKFIAACGIA
jgi:hypothetical protein